MHTGVCAAQTGLGHQGHAVSTSESLSRPQGRLWAPWGSVRADRRAEGMEGGLDDATRSGAPLELTCVVAVLPLAQLCSCFWVSVQITHLGDHLYPSDPLRAQDTSSRMRYHQGSVRCPSHHS